MASYYHPPLSSSGFPRPSSAVYDELSSPFHSSRPLSTPDFAADYPPQPFPLNPSPRHFIYPPFSNIAPHQRPMHHRRPPPPSLYDDPAFSSDPRENPHFSMTLGEQIVPANNSAFNLQQNTPSDYRHSRDGSARAQEALPRHAPSRPSYQSYSSKVPSNAPPRLQPRVAGEKAPLDVYSAPVLPPSSMAKLKRPLAPPAGYDARALLPPPRYDAWSSDSSPASSEESVPHSDISSAPTTPSSSPPAPLHSKLFKLSHRKAEKHDEDRTIAHPPPPPYVNNSAAPQRGERLPFPTNSSAPELRPPPAPAADVPPRPVTVPVPPITGSATHPNAIPAHAPSSSSRTTTTVPAPEVRKSRSRKTSVAAAPKDLARIEELDETDPLGLWHHDSPYDAALHAIKNGALDAIGAGAGANGKSKNKDGNKSSQGNPKGPINPNTTSFNVSPGEIFPSLGRNMPTPMNNPPPPLDQPKHPQLSKPSSRLAPPPQLQSQASRHSPQPAQSAPLPPSSARPPQQDVGQAAPPVYDERNGRPRLEQAVQRPAPTPQQPAHAMQPSDHTPQHSRNSTYLTVPEPSESDLAYTLPSPVPTLPNPYDAQEQGEQGKLHNNNHYRISETPTEKLTLSNPYDAQDEHKLHKHHHAPQNLPQQNMMSQQPRVHFHDGSNSSGSVEDLRRMSSAGPPQGRGPNEQLNADLYRSPSAPNNSRPLSQAYSQAPAPPRPDINLPPRHTAPSQKSSSSQTRPAPHYLPKKLVMPTPLQQPAQSLPPQPQQVHHVQLQRPGLAAYGDSAGSSASGSSGESLSAGGYMRGPPGLGASPLSGPMSTPAQSLPQQGLLPSSGTQKKAKDIPISHGRNLLRKKTADKEKEKEKAGIVIPPNIGPLGPGLAKEGYVPSSNAAAALFASKVNVGGVPRNNGGSGGLGASPVGPAVAASNAETWERKARERTKELEKEKEREREKEKEEDKEREREREKEKSKGGRKLSKRR
ncbi:hypothetical protein K474DRAFT_1704902 [Panus rudis PR-1116 ss-1]|nr:hypothetical protein K474DRAFT_1704902 [Panus rudis PR-1116 ss-1]